jgi:hypothetical protein
MLDPIQNRVSASFALLETAYLKALLYMMIMVIRVVEFSSGGTKLEKHFPKDQQTQRKILNFENWCNGKVSKIGHHFTNEVI